MINLNEEKFNQKEGKAIFNDGKSGVVENVAISVSKKTPEDKEKSPDFKLVFKDSNGAECNLGFWVILEGSAFKTKEELIMSQGKVLKHLVHAVYGPDYELPSFATPTEMLNTCMKLISQGCAGKGNVFRIFTNYGTTTSPKTHLQPRSWVPMVETMATPLSETRLMASSIEQMVKISPDTPSTSAPKIVDEEW